MILVVVEHQQGHITAASLSCITAARALSDQVHCLLVGDQVEEAAQHCAQVEGVDTVLTAQHPDFAHPLAEQVAGLLLHCVQTFEASHLLMAATSFGKDVMPRTAALLDVGQLSDIVAILSSDTVKRPMYAGNALATVKSLDAVKCMTVRASAFSKAALGEASAKIQALAYQPEVTTTEWVSDQLSDSERPELSSASIVVSGGRGLKDAQTFELLSEIADQLGAAMGASRAAVDAGLVANELQVGQTGQIVAPDLYIAIGISGAIQHLAGMKDSKVIVAINSDPDAPIFQVADYGLVADLFAVLPELKQRLSKQTV